MANILGHFTHSSICVVFAQAATDLCKSTKGDAVQLQRIELNKAIELAHDVALNQQLRDNIQAAVDQNRENVDINMLSIPEKLVRTLVDRRAAVAQELHNFFRAAKAEATKRSNDWPKQRAHLSHKCERAQTAHKGMKQSQQVRTT